MTLKEIAAIALDEVSAVEDASYFDGVKRHMVDQPVRKTRPSELAAHDLHFHPDGFDPETDTCKFRERMAEKDDTDIIGDAPVAAAKLPEGIAVEKADITKQPVDAIVNAANRWMLGGGGVDGAIHRAAGPELVAECAKYPADANGYRVQTGGAKITGAGKLPSKFVIHTAGPDVREFAAKYAPPPPPPSDFGEDDDLFGFGFGGGLGRGLGFGDISLIDDEGWKGLDGLLADSYRNSLDLAAKNGCKSVAFPSISTGIFGFPIDRAAKVAAGEVAKFHEEHPDVSVKMCIFDPNPAVEKQLLEAYNREFAAAMPVEGETAEDADADSSQSQGQQPMTDLQKHDAKYHPKGYKKGDKCKYRENLAKGDKADQLDPEDVDGDTDASGSANLGSAAQQLTKIATALNDKVDDIAKGVQGTGLGLGDIADGLNDYEKTYDDATGNTPGAKALAALAKKSGNGAMAAILNQQLAAVKTNAAASNLPAGTKTPQELRNEVALALAKMLGANLEAPKPAATSGATQTPAKQRRNPDIPEELEDALIAAKINPSFPDFKAGKSKQNDPYYIWEDEAYLSEQIQNKVAADIARNLPKGWQSGVYQDNGKWNLVFGLEKALSDLDLAHRFDAQTGKELPSPNKGKAQLGPNPALPHNFTALPAGMNLADFNKWPRAGGSTGLRKYTDPNTGKSYGVKHSGGMAGGVNIPGDAIIEDWLADQMLRMAGFNAPDGIVVAGPNGQVFKVSEWNDNLARGIGSGNANAKETAQLRAVYPLMALLYNQDASQNGDNMMVDKNGDVVFTDNGSSLGSRARGGTISWYAGRHDADSTANDKGIMQLMQHNDQDMWRDAFGLSGKVGSYGGTAPAASQDKVLQEAAKYNMSDLVDEAEKMLNNTVGAGVYGNHQKKWGNLSKWAKSLDALSAKYKQQSPAQTASATPAQPAQQTAAAAAAPVASATPSPATAATSASAQTSSPPIYTSGNSLYNNYITLYGGANAASWAPTGNGRQSRNAAGFLNAVAAIPSSVYSSFPSAAKAALTSIMHGQFTANKAGFGGMVTGANIPRKGVQTVGKVLNQVLNPQGYKVQIHNNGNVSIGLSNRGIANQAMQAAGISTPSQAAAAAAPSSSAPPASAASAVQHTTWAAGFNPHAGSVKPGNTWIPPGTPTKFAKAFKGRILGPTFSYVLTNGATSGSYVLGLAPGQQHKITSATAKSALPNAPSIAGYTKSVMPNGSGILYTPTTTSSQTASSPSATASAASSATSAPRPAPAAATPSSPAPASAPAAPSSPKQGGWKNRLSKLQQNAPSSVLGSSYNIVSNWLGGGSGGGQAASPAPAAPAAAQNAPAAPTAPSAPAGGKKGKRTAPSANFIQNRGTNAPSQNLKNAYSQLSQWMQGNAGI